MKYIPDVLVSNAHRPMLNAQCFILNYEYCNYSFSRNK